MHKALSAVYAYYAANRQMFANWLRDAELIPELKQFAEGGYYDFVAQLRDQILDEPACGAISRPGMLVALQFDTWRTLGEREGLSPEEAAAAMTQVLVCHDD
ncbi:MAG TPA: hypothetical protein VG845_09570 [Dehalococcoidia bacterium]|nr:hypothetical protein [Dehalococcoidia bacterium]